MLPYKQEPMQTVEQCNKTRIAGYYQGIISRRLQKTVFSQWDIICIHRSLTGNQMGDILSCCAFYLFRAMSRVKETSSCAAALLLCTVMALPAATGETRKIQSACALQCTRKVSLGKTEAKCTLPADVHSLKCSCRQLLDISQNVSSLWVVLRSFHIHQKKKCWVANNTVLFFKVFVRQQIDWGTHFDILELR